MNNGVVTVNTVQPFLADLGCFYQHRPKVGARVFSAQASPDV
jgi:hypothetical protein